MPDAEKEPTEGKEPTEEEILAAAQPGKASPLDPDLILIFFFALFGDLAIDPIVETIGLPTIILPILSRGFDVLTLIIIGGWMYWKGKQFTLAGKMGESLKKMEKKALAKIQAKITKKVGQKVLGKVLIRVIPALIIEFIPAISLFTSWSVAVLTMLF